MKQMCTHHWYFESPEGSESEGVCIKCGLKTKQKNSIYEGWGHIHLGTIGKYSYENSVERILTKNNRRY